MVVLRFIGMKEVDTGDIVVHHMSLKIDQHAGMLLQESKVPQSIHRIHTYGVISSFG